MDCIDLSQFSKYKLGKDPAAGPRSKDPWMLTIECHNGHIYPFGGQFLAASTNGRGPVATKLKKLGRLHQDGDDGVTVIFNAADLPKVAKVMRPKRQRTLSIPDRAKFVAAGRRNRISTGVGSPENEQIHALAV